MDINSIVSAAVSRPSMRCLASPLPGASMMPAVDAPQILAKQVAWRERTHPASLGKATQDFQGGRSTGFGVYAVIDRTFSTRLGLFSCRPPV